MPQESKFTVGQERLRELYAMLAGVPEERFDLLNWRDGGVNDEELLKQGCGTAACAVGWACAYPPFIEQGLSFGHRMPSFNGSVNWDAVTKFFGLQMCEAHRLFERYYYSCRATPDRVRRRILDVLERQNALTEQEVAAIVARDGLEARP